MSAESLPLELPEPMGIAEVEARLGYDIAPRMAGFLVVMATAVGAVVRLAPFGGNAFPLNDGGSVYELVRSLLSHGFNVPFDFNYNGLALPWASPPVPIFLIAFVAGGFNIPIPYAQTFVAVAVSILTIPVVYLLARQLLDSRQGAAGAAFAYALLPHAFEWFLTGTGAARGLAFIFTMLALQQGLVLMRRVSWVNAVNTGVLLGLTVMTSLRGAVLLVLSLMILALFRARHPRPVLLFGLSLVAAGLTTWSWLDVVISKHGVGAIASALVAGSDPATSLKTLLSFNLSGAPILDVLSILGVVGGVALLVERRPMLPFWFLALFLVDQRIGIAFAMVPFAMMASHAATEVVVRWPQALHLRERGARLDRFTTAVFASALFLTALLGALTAQVASASPLRGINDDSIAAMVWARDHLNPESRFVVLAPTAWENDAFGSWFPAVAGMQNVGSVQGYEWLGLDTFAAQQQRHADIAECSSHTIDCIESWITTQQTAVDYVLIPKSLAPRPDCCPAARESMRTSPQFRVVYDGPGATIGAVLAGGAVTDPAMVGAGDIAGCDTPGAASTAALIAHIPGSVFTLGDNAYDTGTAQEFADCYDPTWGRFKDRTRPVAGNHEYFSAAAQPYFNYFAESAGNANEGWYSYDIGTWHIVVLNSDCAGVGGCGPGSRQLAWLQNDLASSHAQCTLAMWHHPLFTSGSELPTSATADFWRVLYGAGADIVLNGHDHDYERFAPMAPDGTLDAADGIREFVVGTGGKSLLPWRSVPAPGTQVRDNSTFGVLKLTLHPNSYDWQFIPVVDGAFSDSGSGTCH